MVVEMMRRCIFAPPGTPLVTPKYGVDRAQENKLPLCRMLCIMCVEPSGIASVFMYYAIVTACYVTVYATVAKYYTTVAVYYANVAVYNAANAAVAEY